MGEYRRSIDKLDRFWRVKSADLGRGWGARPVGVRQFLTDAHHNSMRAMIRGSCCGFLLAAPIGDGHVECSDALAIFDENGIFTLHVRVSTSLSQPVYFIIGCCTNTERRWGAVIGGLNVASLPGTPYAASRGDFREVLPSRWLSQNYPVARDDGVTFRISSTLDTRLQPLVEHWATTFPARLFRPFDPGDMEEYFTGSAAGDQMLIDSSLGEAQDAPEQGDLRLRIVFE